MSPAVNIGCRQVLQCLMNPFIVVIINELCLLTTQLIRVIIIAQLHHVLQRPVVPLDLALGLRMIRSTTRVLHLLFFQSIQSDL